MPERSDEAPGAEGEGRGRGRGDYTRENACRSYSPLTSAYVPSQDGVLCRVFAGSVWFDKDSTSCYHITVVHPGVATPNPFATGWFI